MRLLLLLAVACLCSCASGPPTPSGRPELHVALPVGATKDRLSVAAAQDGWMVTSSDDLGVTMQCPVNDGHAFLIGTGTWLSRFNLTPTNSGTQIRAVCYLQRGSYGTQDVSSATQGRMTQEGLEKIFHDVMIDGPYTPPPKPAHGAAGDGWTHTGNR